MCCPAFPHVLPHRPQIVIGLLVLMFGQDLPDGERPAPLVWCCLHCAAAGCYGRGKQSTTAIRLLMVHSAAAAPLSPGNYGALRKAGKKDKAKTHMEMLAAVKNYR